MSKEIQKIKTESEENIILKIDKQVFYNPNMRFCRSISSLAVGAIDQELEIIDGFCASGIRGFRYLGENKNVTKVTSIDIDEKAIKNAKINVRLNANSSTNIDKSKIRFVYGNLSKEAFSHNGDFVEIDPFGTPSPYIVDAMRFLNPKKIAYLSATATDTAVLCGAKKEACMKNYHSKPLKSSATHEIGLRILIKRISEVASEFNFGVSSLISFSNRHYLKVILKLERNAEKVDETLSNWGYMTECKKCLYRKISEFPLNKCENCGAKEPDQKDTDTKILDYAGPLYLGELYQKKFVEKMIKLNENRNYSNKREISKFLKTIKEESEIGSFFYYDIHELCRIYKLGGVPNFDRIIESIKKAGHKVSRTHFLATAIKSEIKLKKLVEILKKLKTEK